MKKKKKRRREGTSELHREHAFHGVLPKATEPLILIIGYSLPLLVPEAYLSAETTPPCIATRTVAPALYLLFFPFSYTRIGRCYTCST